MGTDDQGRFGRRTALGLIASASALPLLGGCTKTKGTTMSSQTQTTSSNGTMMPTLFIAHGAPPLLDDAGWVNELATWAKQLPRPKAVLMLSAHWEERPVTLGATQTVPLVYDFYGFPERYYQVKYPAPGAPELAARVRALLGQTQPVADEPTRGLDHGAYVPLVAMYPNADVPVLQVSLPTMDPKTLLELGRALAPLRQEGVLIIGSGFLTHNLRMVDWDGTRGTPTWAKEFDGWAAETFSQGNIDALLDYRAKAPGVRNALPTHEHFVPAIVAQGAAIERHDKVTYPISGFWMGSLTRRSMQFG